MVSNGRLVVPGVPQGERAKISPEALEVIFLDEIAGRLEDLGEHMTQLARGIQSRGRSKGLGVPGALAEEAASAGVPYRYAIKKYPLTEAKKDVQEVVYADYFDYSTDGDPSDITVRFDDPNAQEIPLDMFRGIPIPGGFRKVYLSWPAQSGKTLVVFYGLGIAASGVGVQVLQPPVASAAVPVLKTDGRISTSSEEYQAAATWTIPAGKVGNLTTVSCIADQPTIAQWRFTRTDQDGTVTTYFTDRLIQAGMAFAWPDNQLASGTVLALQVRSDGSTTIAADAFLTGTEK